MKACVLSDYFMNLFDYIISSMLYAQLFWSSPRTIRATGYSTESTGYRYILANIGDD